jgi:hypothetical protein
LLFLERRSERIERMNVVVGKEWLRVEMSQVVCVVVTGQDNGEQKGGLECDGRLHLQVSTGLVVQRGLYFARRSIAWLKDHANCKRQVPFWLGLQTDTPS